MSSTSCITINSTCPYCPHVILDISFSKDVSFTILLLNTRKPINSRKNLDVSVYRTLCVSQHQSATYASETVTSCVISHPSQNRSLTSESSAPVRKGSDDLQRGVERRVSTASIKRRESILEGSFQVYWDSSPTKSLSTELVSPSKMGPLLSCSSRARICPILRKSATTAAANQTTKTPSTPHPIPPRSPMQHAHRQLPRPNLPPKTIRQERKKSRPNEPRPATCGNPQIIRVSTLSKRSEDLAAPASICYTGRIRIEKRMPSVRPRELLPLSTQLDSTPPRQNWREITVSEDPMPVRLEGGIDWGPCTYESNRRVRSPCSSNSSSGHGSVRPLRRREARTSRLPRFPYLLAPEPRLSEKRGGGGRWVSTSSSRAHPLPPNSHRTHARRLPFPPSHSHFLCLKFRTQSWVPMLHLTRDSSSLQGFFLHPSIHPPIHPYTSANPTPSPSSVVSLSRRSCFDHLYNPMQYTTLKALHQHVIRSQHESIKTRYHLTSTVPFASVGRILYLCM